MGVVKIKGIRFDLVPHVARGASGSAWSAYVEGEDEPFRMIQRRTASELIEALKAAVGPERTDRYRAALLEIKNEQGKVCNEFELCDHAACRSSYTSWAIADAALSENSGPNLL